MTIELPKVGFPVWIEITPGDGYTMRTERGDIWEIVDDPDPAADPEEISSERFGIGDVAEEVRACLVGRDLDRMWKVTGVWPGERA